MERQLFGRVGCLDLLKKNIVFISLVLCTAVFFCILSSSSFLYCIQRFFLALCPFWREELPCVLSTRAPLYFVQQFSFYCVLQSSFILCPAKLPCIVSCSTTEIPCNVSHSTTELPCKFHSYVCRKKKKKKKKSIILWSIKHSKEQLKISK